jgi:FkbM family methyltransferase
MYTSIKSGLQKILFPLGSTQTIKWGYLKGSQLILSENTQWAPMFGRWEPAMQKIIFNVVRKGDVVYDLGANFGLHGMLCARLIGKEGLVTNFEPLPENINEINRNYSINGITNFKNIQKAVSNRNSKLTFSVAKHATQGKLIDNHYEDNNNLIQVDTITLDAFIGDGGALPSFIKMDIEGAEGDALEGYSNNIVKTFPEMIIELHSPEADKKVGLFLKEYKYKAYRFNTFRSLQFEEIKDLTSPYPDKEGIWGSIFCIGPNKTINDYSFKD